MGSVLVEGEARLRQGKKWKTRWLVLRKPSPVADCLTLFAYKSSSDAMRGRDPRKMLMLREVCVLQRVPPFDGVNHVLLMLCASQLMLLLGFDRLDAILAWEVRVRHILGEVHSFAVTLAPGSMLEPGPAQLHCVNQTLALVRGCPPRLLTRWSLPEVRRYGAVPGGFVLEGGSRCAMDRLKQLLFSSVRMHAWDETTYNLPNSEPKHCQTAGCGAVFLACDNGDQIRNLLDCVGQGLTPSRPPHGVLPIMPGMNMPNESGQREGDERALRDLESRLKRLSMSSQESSASSSSVGHVRSFTLPGMSSRSPDSNSGSSWLSLFSGSSSLSEPQSSTSESAKDVATVASGTTAASMNSNRCTWMRPTCPGRSLSDSGIASSSTSPASSSCSSSLTGISFNEDLLDSGMQHRAYMPGCHPLPRSEGTGTAAGEKVYDTPRNIRGCSCQLCCGQMLTTPIRDMHAEISIGVEDPRVSGDSSVTTNVGAEQVPLVLSTAHAVPVPSPYVVWEEWRQAFHMPAPK